MSTLLASFRWYIAMNFGEADLVLPGLLGDTNEHKSPCTSTTALRFGPPGECFLFGCGPSRCVVSLWWWGFGSQVSGFFSVVAPKVSGFFLAVSPKVSRFLYSVSAPARYVVSFPSPEGGTLVLAHTSTKMPLGRKYRLYEYGTRPSPSGRQFPKSCRRELFRTSAEVGRRDA